MNMESTIQNISIEKIIPNRFQPRLSFDEQALNELSASIKEHGIIQPLVLRRLGDKYEIIAGERRYKAATLAGLTEVPAIISNMDDNKSAEVALVENVQRKNLSSIEEAKSYKKILDRGYVNQEELAKKLGVTQPTIANRLRLLSLTEEVQEALMNGKISERHARSLLQINAPEEQINMLNRVINERMTVRQLDDEIKRLLNKEEPSNVVNTPEPVEEKPNNIFSDTIANLFATTPTEEEIVGTPLPDDTLESLDIDLPESEPVVEEPKEDEKESLRKNILNIFDTTKEEYPSLEDEVTSLRMDPSEPIIEEEKEEETLPSIENIFDSNPVPVVEPEPVVEEVKERIISNDFASVKKAYDELFEELEKAGFKAKKEIFDFEDLYQIIIKIDKQAD